MIATQLPDGSRIAYGKNGQGQVVALTRNPIQTHWLRWAVADQTLAKDFQRDLAGLSAYTAGNGVQSQWQRSPAGDLARIVHRAPASIQTITAGKASQGLLGHSTQDTIERLLGITAAHAQTTQQAAPQKQGENANSFLPGALGIARDPQALIDHRYLWDDRGNLLLSQNPTGSTTEQSAHAYTRQGQLIASVRSTVPEVGMQQVSGKADQNTAKEQHTWRYAYDSQQRRILAQETTEQSELQANTQKQQFQPNSAKLQNTEYDTTGMASTARQANNTQLHYRWDAAGRLMSIGQSDANGKRSKIARYQYDHRGLRNTKTVQGEQAIHYLYSEDKQLLAEVTQDGKITRQYVYLADIPIAVIDSTEGKSLRKAQPDSLSKSEHSAKIGRAGTAQNASNSEQNLSSEESKATIIWADLKTIAHIWMQALGADRSEHTAFIHTNHLGAPEVATDEAAQPIWQASYAPFGNIIKTSLKTKAVRPELLEGKAMQGSNLAFILNFRLPGQYEDQESGLHYNRQRYYDPAQGSYISPDPLGTPDGPNPYAYTAFNPLKYIDPDGLILFAFDGTGNDESNAGSLTNVVRFREMYNDGNARYVAGVGTDHRDRNGENYGPITASTFFETVTIAGISTNNVIPDRGGNYSGPTRIDRMMLYLTDEAEAERDNNKILDIDIIGFSRGAAQARDFANRIASRVNNGWLTYQLHDQNGRLLMNPRLPGQPLTACQRVNLRFLGLWDTVISTNRSGYDYQLNIPAQFQHVAHAVALNEYRSAPSGENAFVTAPNNFALWNNTRDHLRNDDHYGSFPLRSIGASSNTSGRVRIERGFIGAHADIGGGYPEGENSLSTVALSWMIGQAQGAGVRMNIGSFNTAPITSNPVIHDQSNAIRVGRPTEVNGAAVRFQAPGRLFGTNNYTVEDRQVVGGQGGGTQRTQTFGAPEAGGNRGMTHADTHQFINYTPRNFQFNDTRRTEDIQEVTQLNNRTGTVDMSGYISWLRNNGYTLAGSNQFGP